MWARVLGVTVRGLSEGRWVVRSNTLGRWVRGFAGRCGWRVEKDRGLGWDGAAWSSCGYGGRYEVVKSAGDRGFGGIGKLCCMGSSLVQVW